MRLSCPARLPALFLTILLPLAAAYHPTQTDLELLHDARQVREKGELDSALRMLDWVIQRAPAWTWAYQERAATYLAGNQYMKAWEDTERALQLDPNAPGIFPVRARIRLATFDYEGAIVDATRSGNSTDMIEVRGAARMALGRYAEAKADYEYLRSGRFGPYTNARYPFAVCLLGTGEVADAVDWLRTDYADGGYVMSRWCMVLGMVMLGRYEDAEKDLDDWIGVASGPAPKDDYERGAWEGLKANLNAADYLMGVVSFAGEDFAGAARLLEKVPFESENGQGARLLRHVALLRAGRPSDLEKTMDQFRLPWPLQIARFLTGGITEKELLKTAVAPADLVTRRRQECEAGFYIGQKRLVAKDDSAAAMFFEKAVTTKMVEEEEYALALNALKKG